MKYTTTDAMTRVPCDCNWPICAAQLILESMKRRVGFQHVGFALGNTCLDHATKLRIPHTHCPSEACAHTSEERLDLFDMASKSSSTLQSDLADSLVSAIRPTHLQVAIVDSLEARLDNRVCGTVVFVALLFILAAFFVVYDFISQMWRRISEI